MKGIKLNILLGFIIVTLSPIFLAVCYPVYIEMVNFIWGIFACGAFFLLINAGIRVYKEIED